MMPKRRDPKSAPAYFFILYLSLCSWIGSNVSSTQLNLLCMFVWSPNDALSETRKALNSPSIHYRKKKTRLFACVGADCATTCASVAVPGTCAATRPFDAPCQRSRSSSSTRWTPASRFFGRRGTTCGTGCASESARRRPRIGSSVTPSLLAANRNRLWKPLSKEPVGRRLS